MLKRALVGIGLVTCALAGAAWGRAQAVAVQPVGRIVVSGSDVGFRIEGRKGDTPVGRLVVRQNGEWVEVESPARVLPMSSR